MARTTLAFNDKDLITYAMDGRMIIVRDADDVSLIVENKVVYSTSDKNSMRSFLARQASKPASIFPKACHPYIKVLATKLAMA